MVKQLKQNQIFVFGSNLQGHHIGGAAKQAYEDFGAIWGIGVGIQGKSYAIPTMPPLGIDEIKHYVEQFVEYARLTPESEYLVTPIGTGIAGYTLEIMDKMWSEFNLPSNVKLILQPSIIHIAY